MDQNPVEIDSITKVPVNRLRLDRLNPRLLGAEEESPSDEAAIAWLYRSADLRELLESVSSNGYLDIEPLVVLSDGSSDDGLLTVLEGNRRLATLRLLREPDLVRRIEKCEGLRITVPQISDSLRSTLDQVSVYRVAGRENARAFLGFKHINGAAKWDAYAKARFAADWYRKGRDQGIDLKTIARSIGDRHETIKRMICAIYVLDQAREEGLFRIEDRYSSRLNFSHLYTALSRSQYMTYLGLDKGWARNDPEPNQISKQKYAALRKVLVWMYGLKEDARPPVVRSQNPDIKRLGEVLVHAEGLHVLETRRDLDAAYASTEPVESRFTASLIRARDQLREASNALRAYDGLDISLLEIAEDVKETAVTIHDRMCKKFDETKSPE